MQHMSQPGPLIFGHAANEAAGFAVRTAVVLQPRETFHQRVDEAASEPHRGPCLERPEVEFEANNREVGVDAGADEDAAVDDEHGGRDGRRETGDGGREWCRRRNFASLGGRGGDRDGGYSDWVGMASIVAARVCRL